MTPTPSAPELPRHLNSISARFDLVQLRVMVHGRVAGERFRALIDVPRCRARMMSSEDDPLPALPPPADRGPGTRSSLRGLAAGAWGMVKTGLGVDRAPIAVIAERKSICQRCPSGCYDFGICRRESGGCGCVLDTKVRLGSARCPKGHWEPVNAD